MKTKLFSCLMKIAHPILVGLFMLEEKISVWILGWY